PWRRRNRPGEAFFNPFGLIPRRLRRHDGNHAFDTPLLAAGLFIAPAGVSCPVVPGRASQQPAKKALWLSERERVPL
ncbi:MAG: hypothetical protein WAK57_09700, partial [Desulfobacterales bacterium]